MNISHQFSKLHFKLKCISIQFTKTIIDLRFVISVFPVSFEKHFSVYPKEDVCTYHGPASLNIQTFVLVKVFVDFHFLAFNTQLNAVDHIQKIDYILTQR